MEAPARMTPQPFDHLGVLVSGVVVEDGVDRLAGRDLGSTAFRNRMNS